MRIEQILMECELNQSTFRGGLKCECVKTEQRVYNSVRLIENVSISIGLKVIKQCYIDGE